MTSEVRAVFASDGEKPQRMRGTVTVELSRLRFDLAVKKRGWAPQRTIKFRRYWGRPFYLTFFSWLAAGWGACLPVTAEHLCVRHMRRGQGRLSIDPPWPLDFTLHVYGTEESIRTMLATFEQPQPETRSHTP